MSEVENKEALPRAIGVIGGGMIGASMAAMFAGNGIQAVLLTREGSVEKAKTACEGIYRDLIAHSPVTEHQAACALQRIRYTSDYADLRDITVVFECVYEQLAAKHAVYRMLEQHCGRLQAVASATSAISPDELAAGFTDEALRAKLVVAHPWNPPHLAPCVELVKSRCSAPEATELIRRLLDFVHKKVIVMERSIPGFIGNRLQYAMLREAIHIVEEGAATPEMIDETIKYSFAPRYTEIGLFEHFDNCGQDLTEQVSDYLFPDLCDEKQAQRSVKENVSNGNLGVKTGKGMLDWQDRDITAFREHAAKPYYRFFNWSLPEE